MVHFKGYSYRRKEDPLNHTVEVRDVTGAEATFLVAFAIKYLSLDDGPKDQKIDLAIAFLPKSTMVNKVVNQKGLAISTLS